jgi:CheY-like chemotaxis protein
MEQYPILIVDDEKNIRLTMSQALEPLGGEVHTAVNGEEALQKLAERPFGLVFLDLKMPGINGMETLRRIRLHWPKIRVIIITAHGTIASAVETMKLGAVDFIQKPFSPAEIRELATRVMERECLAEDLVGDYRALIELVKRHITDRAFGVARDTARKAIAADPGQPEAYNLLGALFEITNDRLAAQKYYRAALDIDPTFEPAVVNLERATSWSPSGKIDLGMEPPPRDDKDRTGGPHEG